MSKGEEKRTVDVRDGERGSVVYKDASGEEHVYWPQRYTYFILEDLQTCTYLAESGEGATQPVLKKSIRGTARLKDRSLSVVGDAGTKTTTLEMSLEVSDWRPENASLKDGDHGARLASVLGEACLSFSRGDWELGTDDVWWAACYLPKPYVEQLEAAILDGKLTSVRVGLALRRLYSDRGEWGFVSERSNLFIRPQQETNDIKYPEVVHGFVSSIAFTTTKIDLRTPPNAEDVALADQIAQTLPPLPSATVPDAITALAARLEATRATIKWAAGFITMALLLLATVRG